MSEPDRLPYLFVCLLPSAPASCPCRLPPALRARAVVVGPEAGVLSSEELSATDETVRVPMREPVESLNVAVALAVILYEAARQRAGGRRQGQEAGG